jgi:chromate transporter
MAGGTMSTTLAVLFEIAWRFGAISLLAIGGVNALLPEIHRVVVDVEGWMSSEQFAELFALAQLAPGPNAMIIALLGWQVAGVAGAFVATIALCGPSSIACYLALRWWERIKSSAMRSRVQRSLAPIAIGLIFASGYTIARAADRSYGAVALTLVATGGLAFTRINPVWILAVAAVAGALGLA